MYRKKKRTPKRWQERYANAIESKRQLIGDDVIREALFKGLELAYGDDFEALEEVNFPGFRADVLLFRTGKKKGLLGVEVKSDRDSLDKLERQLQGYCMYCNSVFICTTMTHRAEVLKILNKAEFERVGLLVYMMTNEGNFVDCERGAKFVDIKGLSSDFISRNSKLYRWELYLRGLWV